MIDEGHAGALCFLGDDFTRLALGADKQDGAAVGREFLNVLHRVLIHRQGLFEVDDVNLVALAEDEVRHLRIPVSRLVPEMDASLQHLTHRDRHCFVPFRVEPRSATGPCDGVMSRGTLNRRICEFLGLLRRSRRGNPS